MPTPACDVRREIPARVSEPTSEKQPTSIGHRRKTVGSPSSQICCCPLRIPLSSLVVLYPATLTTHFSACCTRPLPWHWFTALALVYSAPRPSMGARRAPRPSRGSPLPAAALAAAVCSAVLALAPPVRPVHAADDWFELLGGIALEGDAEGDTYGASVQLSADGRTLAVGAASPYSTATDPESVPGGPGHVRCVRAMAASLQTSQGALVSDSTAAAC